MRGPQISEEKAYSVLELKPPVKREKLLSAYRKMAFRYHPDRGGDVAMFRMVTDAKNYILQNPYRGTATDPIVEDEEDFDDVLLKKFMDSVLVWQNAKKNRKMKTAQSGAVTAIIRKMPNALAGVLEIFVFDDEVVIQKRTRTGLWLISIDSFENMILQIDTISISYYDAGTHIFKIYKYPETNAIVLDFLKNQ